MDRWMEDLEPRLKRKALIYLAIPGTHDSMSYTILPTAKISPDNNKAVEYIYKTSRYLAGFFGSYVTMYKYTKIQDMGVIEQLNSGIRYFDIRVGAKPNDPNIYCCHGLWGAEVLMYLQMINAWLDLHLGEVVILDFHHLYDFTQAHHNKLIVDYIKGSFASKLCPYNKWPSVKHCTLKRLIGNGFQVIVLYRDRDIESRNIPELWPGREWVTTWPDTADPDELVAYNTEQLKQRASAPDTGFVTQWVLTPDGPSIVASFWKSFQERYCIPAIDALRPWLRQQRPGPNGINVVIADYVDDGFFQYLIVNLNRKYP